MTRLHVETITAATEAVIVRGELDRIGEFFAPDYVAHFTGKTFSGGHAIVQRSARAYRKAFTEFVVDIDILVEADDRVAWQRTVTALHTGAFKGFPPTDRQIVWHDMVATEFRNGLIAEEWVVTDLAEKLLLARKA